MVIYPLIFSMALVISYLLTPTIRYVALKFDIVDKKDQRKIHRKVITKLGGVSIFLAVVFATLAGFLLEYMTMKPFIGSYGVIIIGATIVLCLGICDDVWGTGFWVKIVTQILAALILIKYNIVVRFIMTPFGAVDLGMFAVPFTILFLVGITNAVNLIDGMDGLAAGTVFLVSLGIFISVIVAHSSMLSAYLACALAGATLGFLRFNAYPAKIFMGDTGSLFLGFILGSIAIDSTIKGSLNPNPLSFLVPLIAMAVPILDTAFVFIRRLYGKKHPFRADKSHLHHWLAARGFSQKQVVSILYLMSVLFVVISFSL